MLNRISEEGLCRFIFGTLVILLLALFALSLSPGTAKADHVEVNHKDLECLAKNIYYEARSSNLADKAAVADVVINRSQDRRYPATICGVVEDGYVAGRRDCQFSWFCDGKSDDPQDLDRWMEAQSIAFTMINFGEYRGITEGATHYHATYVNPFWADSLQMVGTIGAHIYYRWE